MENSTPFVDALKVYYNDIGEKYNSGPMASKHRKDAAALVELAGSRVGENSFVFDLATGTGNVALASAAKIGPNGKVLGADLSEVFVRHARSAAVEQEVDDRVQFISGDAMTMDLLSGHAEPQSFDVAFCASAIMLFPDVRAIIRRISTEVLKPDGIFIANAHSSFVGAVFFEVAETQGIKTTLDPAWLLRPEESLRSAFEDAGMTVKELISDQSTVAEMKFEVATPEARNKMWEMMVVKAPWVSFGLDLSDPDSAQVSGLRKAWEEKLLEMAQEDGYIYGQVSSCAIIAENKDQM